MTTFIIQQKVVFNFSDNEYNYLNPFFISTSAAPAININKTRGILIQQIEKIASLLMLKDGIVHLQYILSDSKIQIIEITRRCSGDLYPYPVQYACNINWGKWIVKAAIGDDCSNFPKTIQKGFCGRHCVMSSQNGIFKSISIDDDFRHHNIFDSISLMNPGDEIKDYLVQKAAILFLKFSSMEEMLQKTNDITKLVRLSIF